MELRPRPLVAAAVTVEYDAERRRSGPKRVRNGVPEVPRYQYRAPRPAWAVRAVAASIAEHGEPRMRRQRGGGYTW